MCCLTFKRKALFSGLRNAQKVLANYCHVCLFKVSCRSNIFYDSFTPKTCKLEDISSEISMGLSTIFTVQYNVITSQSSMCKDICHFQSAYLSIQIKPNKTVSSHGIKLKLFTICVAYLIMLKARDHISVIWLVYSSRLHGFRFD